MRTVVDAEYRPYRLPLRERWQSSRGGLAEREGCIIRLSSGGLWGYGDCAPLPGAGTETPEVAIAWLEQELPRLTGMPPETALESLPSSASCPPAARCGLETALLDLCARLDDRPLSRRLDPGATARVKANASIGALNEHTGNRIFKALGAGFDVLKVKVGIHRIDAELEALRELSKRLPGGVRWRLDANRPSGSWRVCRGCPSRPSKSPSQNPIRHCGDRCRCAPPVPWPWTNPWDCSGWRTGRFAEVYVVF